MLKNFPIELIYAALAVAGGIARYLNAYAIHKEKFNLPIFLASGLVAGFSGLMFAFLGETMNFSDRLLFVMAGVGGYFGEQAMKFLLEFVTSKLK